MLTGGLAATALAGCGAGGHAVKPQRVASEVAPLSTIAAAPPASSVPVRVPPALLALRRALTAALQAAGPSTGAMVYDLATNRVLFALRPGVRRPPASVEKIYTTIAVLKELGPATTLQTTILGSGHLGPGGVWHGDLYLRGGGDPTFGDGEFNRAWNQGYGPTAIQLVRQLSARGIRRVTGRVIGDASLFDALRGGLATHYAPDVPDFGGQLAALTYDHGSTGGRLSPGAFAANELVLTMRDAHIAARAARLTAVTPPDASRLATVSSPPMAVLLKLMDVPSDDFFAELLTKQLGVRFGGGEGSIQAGAQVISAVIGSHGQHPRILDGSGLSRADGSSPSQLIGILRSVWGTAMGRELDDALPVVGVSGTVAGLGLHTPAQGNCLAKTGTLDNVTNLAGYCSSRNHQPLAFALLIDGPPNFQAVTLLGRMVAAIARY